MLHKNEIPILEYDTDKNAVIMPGHSTAFKFTKKAVLLFMNDEIDDYVLENNCEITGVFKKIGGDVFAYKTTHKGTEITFCQAPLGGAGAVMILEQLIAGGAKEFVAVGCCGALVYDTEGDFFVPTTALRDEGASYHYLPPSREVALSEKVIDAIENTLTHRGLCYRKCKTWTTDGFYRETKEMVAYRKEEGCSVVEMECASLAACAKMRGVEFGQLLFTADTLANVEKYDKRTWTKENFRFAMELAFDAVVKI